MIFAEIEKRVCGKSHGKNGVS